MNSQINCPRSRSAGLLAAGAILLSSHAASADLASDWIKGFMEGGKPSLNVRGRYEFNDQSNQPNDVNGFSIRTRLGYLTGEREGWRGMLEMENLSFAESDDRPALDVPTTELNQAWVSYGATKFGRQVYTFDDQRFIGHVGWRQNMQTFDAITTSFPVTDVAKLNLGYIARARRVDATTRDLDGFVANGSYKFSNAFTLVAFAYLLDFEDAFLASSDTFGIRATGTFPTEAAAFSYAFSYARQTDNGGSARDFELDFLAGELGAKVGAFDFALGADLKEGDGATGFTTPLATVHAFDGFADVFAANSLGLAGGLARGLHDYYASAGYTLPGKFPVKVYYHKFKTDVGDMDLGNEVDIVVTRKINDYLSVLAKYAKYEADATFGYGSFDKTVFTFEVNMIY